MKRSLTRGLRAGCVAVALACGTTAGATSFSTNYSDLWWNPDESGWGVNITQQADVMFATLFLYGDRGQAIWYVATLSYVGENITGSKSWSGDLYETNGPYHVGPFDPALVTAKKIGVATFASNANDTAVFQYITSSAAITKNIQRQTLVNDTLAGAYLGATSDVTTSCTNPADNGIRTEDVGAITVTHAAGTVTIQAPTCRFTGNYLQRGQVGNVHGSYTCSNGAVGTIDFFDLRVERSGLLGRYTGNGSGCRFFGNIGAMRKP
jgi:hypothetical protein